MLVSILIPCYNAERWIAQAIESALAETWPEKEVIVVDDGSTDRSVEVIESFAGRIRWETGPHLGGNPARNRLLDLARGTWVQYLDADDYLLPDKIAGQVEFLRERPEADIVFGPVTLEHWHGTGSRRVLLAIPEPHDPWVLLARWYLPQTGAILWRKEAVQSVGGWKPQQPCCQEHELYLRLLMAGRRFNYCSSGGAVYRQWGEHTLWRRNRSEVRRRRLEIQDRAESFLRDQGGLTHTRLWAINQSRFEIARTAWQHDRIEARAIIRSIQQSQSDFIPAGAAAPPGYRFMYRLLGFGPAETVAAWRRRLKRGKSAAAAA